MELDSRLSIWLSIVLFLTFSSASETDGERDVVTSSFKPTFSTTSQNYYAEGGGPQSNYFSSISKRKVTARKEASPLTSSEKTTDLRPHIPSVNPETNAENRNDSRISQVGSGNNEDHSIHPEMPQFLNASSVMVTSPNTNHLSQESFSGAPVNVSSPEEPTSPQVPAIALTTTSTPKRKNKPDVTYDENDLPRDENGTLILPKEGLIESGPSFDYIVPIVITMLAVPFLAVAGVFFYKRLCDFWDRRHYRRMDFLIDGMYND